MQYLKQKVSNLYTKKSVKNILWLSFDKFFKLGVSVFVGAWAARFYGPSDLGSFNFVNAYVAIFVVIANLGMDSFLVKELLSNKTKPHVILGSSFVIRLLVALSIFALGWVYFYFNNTSKNYLEIYLFLSFTILFSPFDLIDIEYQSLLLSKKTVIAKNSAYIFGAALKLVFLHFHKPLIYYVAASSVEVILAYIILISQYSAQKEKGIFSWKAEKIVSKYILKAAWPFTLSGLSVILYMRIDQIMIGNYLSTKQVGEFSGAVRIAELFFFIPSVITSSYYSTLMKSINSTDRFGYLKKNQILFNYALLLALAIGIVVFISSKLLIITLLGIKFIAAIQILRVYIWSLLAIFLGVASGPYFAIENLQQISFYKTILGLTINIICNLFFIPSYGALGAAYATLISQFFTSIFSNMLFKRTREVFYIQMKSFKSLLLLKVTDFKFEKK